MFFKVLAVTAWLSLSAVVAAPTTSGPAVTLDAATFTGKCSGNTASFLGIPFAQPPIGDLRFRLPEPIEPYGNGTFTATAFGPACPQQAIKLPILTGLPADAVDFIVNSIFGTVFPDSEDCLTINVIKPAAATPSSKLPVVAWIFGGGFQIGSPSFYDGAPIVERSIELGSPVIYVSMNYRLTGFGFMPGKEVKAAGVGNLGLQDQREAFRWIQKYIAQFGGDPTKVTIWGESAGALSVAHHMIANDGNTEGLFRAGFMQSGSPLPMGDITNGQKYYDAIVEETGCSSAYDTLACLRTVPYAQLKDAINQSPSIFGYQSLFAAWLPHADGIFLTSNPQQLVQQGKVANIPIVSGDCDDEGTLFSLSTLNITTSAEIATYISSFWLTSDSNITSDINTLATLYPGDITQGSPYDTGFLNALTPENKRLASLIGDGVFQAPRRFFLQNLSGKQDIWAFLSKRFKLLPVLGSAHGSDLLNVYGGGELADYLIRFVSNLDPNAPARGDGGVTFNWPKYTTSSPNLLTFLDGFIPLQISQDTYRQAAMEALTQIELANPI